jgi:hypothetical protein
MRHPLTEPEFSAAKAELRTLLEGEIVTELSTGQVEVVTHLEPLEVDKPLRQFSAKYGIVEFRAGSKLG